MSPEHDRHLDAAPRPMEIVTGVVLGVFATGFGVVAAVLLYVTINGEKVASGSLTGALVFLVVAALALPKAYRLVVGTRGQPDRALFSPLSLRIAGTLFLLAPVAIGLSHPIGLLDLLPGIGASAASFALARTRSPHSNSRAPGVEGQPIESR